MEYFTNLFHTSNSGDIDELLDGFETRVTDRMNRGLVEEVTEAEIHRAVKAIR